LETNLNFPNLESKIIPPYLIQGQALEAELQDTAHYQTAKKHFSQESKNLIFSFHYFVTEKDIDTFMHVNNANYMRFMEDARWDFITKNGYGLEKVHQELKGPVLLESHLRFRRELKNREWIHIYSQIQGRLNEKIYQLKQLIVKDSGVLSCEANMTVGFFHTTERKLIIPPQIWLDAIGVVL